jgi:RNA polymerase sigma factor (sigma-70 family)
VERMNKGPAVAAPPLTLEQLEVFYTVEYPRLVKLLVFLDATVEEAEDAAQRAMADFVKRSKVAGVRLDHAAWYVRRAAVNFFIKERQRDRDRLQREVRGGHLVIEAHLDDQLTTLEDEQFIEHLIGCLTPTQQQVFRLIMAGLSARAIAEELGKSNDDVRQHLKNARNRLKQDPEIAPLVPRYDQSPVRQGARSTVTTPEPRKEEVQ